MEVGTPTVLAGRYRVLQRLGSGGMATSTAYYLGQSGVRISSIVHVGGDTTSTPGPLTIAMLMSNTVKAAKMRRGRQVVELSRV